MGERIGTPLSTLINDFLYARYLLHIDEWSYKLSDNIRDIFELSNNPFATAFEVSISISVTFN